MSRHGQFEADLRQARGGDEDALMRLLSDSLPRLRRLVVRDLPARHRGIISEEDVLQQTFVDAFRDIGSFAAEAEPAFRTWLATLARRNLTDAVRMLDAEKRGGGRRRVGGADREASCLDLVERLAVTSGPSAAISRREARDALETALDALPELYRAVVEGYDLEDRPMEQVASEIGRTRGAAYMVRARAHRMLRDLMGRTSGFFSRSP